MSEAYGIIETLAQLRDSDKVEAKILPLARRLKVLTRDRNACLDIYSHSCARTLLEFAFPSDRGLHLDSSRELLRCIANCLFLEEAVRAIYIAVGAPTLTANLLQKLPDADDEFLASRILFLLSARDSGSIKELIEDSEFVSALDKCIAEHRRWLVAGMTKPPMARLAMSETLKLIFNLAHHDQSKSRLLEGCVYSTISLFEALLSSSQEETAISHCTNAVLILELNAADLDAFPTLPSLLLARLDVRLHSISQSREEEDSLIPLVSLLSKLFNLKIETICAQLANTLLITERSLPLGCGQSLGSRLLDTSNKASAIVLRECILLLFFDVSNRNANKFILNVGYGHASGFLASHKIQFMPESLPNVTTTGLEINPVTGQSWTAEKESAANIPQMTEEEKEREAEKLFVLFQRLEKNGVMQAKNPIREAVESGRFEELT